MKKNTLPTIFNGILVLCALVITVLVVKRNLFANNKQNNKRKVTQIKHWQRLKHSGHYYFGNKNRPVQIIEFFDFQCPYCYNFEQTLSLIEEDYPKKIAVEKINYPLEMHPYAYPAAIAVECAARQHHYNSYHDLLFKNHRNLKDIDWDRLADSAHIKDVASFHKCIKNKLPKSEVDQNIKQSKRIGVDATPTVMVNGKLVAGALGYKELNSMIKSVLAAK